MVNFEIKSVKAKKKRFKILKYYYQNRININYLKMK